MIKKEDGILLLIPSSFMLDFKHKIIYNKENFKNIVNKGKNKFMIKTSIKEQSKELKKETEKREEKEIIKEQKNVYILHIVLIAVSLILLFISMKYFEDAKKIITLENFQYTIVTFIIWICEYLILKGITNKSKLSLSIVIGIEALYDVINYAVRTIRGSAITISDIFAIRTALSVSNNVNFEMDRNFIFGIVFAITIIALIIIFRKKFIENKDSLVLRCIKITIGFLIIFILSKTSIYNRYSLWDINEAYSTLGTPITILRMAHDIKVKPPVGYNKNEIQSILEKYRENTTEEAEEDKPNIIVIVNESFCDYYNLYKEGTKDPIEYFTNLSKGENVVSGVMYSSTFGGQTSNVEYEFLTQNSIKILPIGTYVFQQHIKGPVKDSLVQNLKSQGYKTSAIHPWESYAYSRNKIYQFFGFDSIKFKNDIEGLEKNFNNDFFSDKSTYKELMKQINEKRENKKLFEYVLTVQNHTGYLNTDPEQITYSDEFVKNVYMQLIHKSAEALEEVINELKQKDEKYILLFFGDHQPNLDDSDNFEEKSTKEYQVPFLIWANYDIEEQYNVQTSTIYLQNYLLKSAGVKFSAMNNYMEELKKYYPVITKRFCIDTAGNELKNEEDTSKNVEKIKNYEKIDYYRIFE